MAATSAGNVHVTTASATGSAVQLIGNVTLKNYYGLSSDDEVDSQWLRVVRFLSPPDEAIRLQQLIHSEARNSQEPGTGLWFVNGSLFQDWLAGRFPLISYHGQVGCGKTVLISLAVEQVGKLCKTKKHSYVGYFYCTSRGPSGNEVAQVLRQLIVQLCPPPEVPNVVQALYKSCNDRFPPRFPTVHELAKTLLEMVSASTSSSTVQSSEETPEFYLLVDGLDELQWSTRNDLFRALNPIISLQLQNVRFLMAGRHSSHIPTLPNVAVWKQIDLDMTLIQSDIEMFISNEVNSHTPLRKLDQNTKDAIQQRVAVEANGMFRWAYLQLQALKRIKPPVKSSKIFRALESLPPDLDGTYVKRLQEIDEFDTTQASTALKWVAFSSRQLYIEEMIDACALNPSESPVLGDRMSPSDFFELTRDLILIQPGISSDQDTITPRTHAVILTHASLREFLLGLGDRKTEFPPATQSFALNESESHLFLAQSCFSYLYHYNNYELRHSDFPLMRYAWYHWEDHVDTPPEQCLPTMPTTVLRRKAIRLFRILKQTLSMARDHSDLTTSLDAAHDEMTALDGALPALIRSNAQALRTLLSAINIPFFNSEFDEFCPPDAWHSEDFCDQTQPPAANHGIQSIWQPSETLFSPPRRLARSSTATSTDSYVHTPLEGPGMLVRLLRLLPSIDPETTIRCRLITVDLETTEQPYQALSYSWDSNPNFEVVTVEGHRVQVHPRQLELLQTLRSRADDTDTAIWLDSLCMNQSDYCEISHQVMIMPEIFCRAREVVIGLAGSVDAEADDHAVQLLAQASAAAVPLITEDTDSTTRAQAMKKLRQIERRRGWRFIRRIFNDPWWTGRCVIEEVSPGVTPVILFGTLSFNFNIIEQLASAEPTIRESLSEAQKLTSGWLELQNTPGWEVAKEMTRTRHDYHHGRTLELPTILWRFRFNKCLDGRDILYTVLRLCWSDDILPPTFMPDYTIPVESLFIATTRWMLEKYQRLDTLSINSAYYHDPNSSLTLPSWVLPLHSLVNRRKPLLLGVFDGRNSFTTYNACGDVTTAIIQSASDTVLSLRGLCFDRIINRPTGRGYVYGLDNPSLRELFRRISSDQVSLRSSQRSVEARWKTLLANQWPPGERLISGEFQGHPFPPITLEQEEGLFRTLDLWSRDEEEEEHFRLHQAGPTPPTRTQDFHFLEGREIVITLGGHLGLVPKEALDGDVIAVFPGGAVPYVLRPTTPGCYKFIGECYIHNCMYGSVVGGLEKEWWTDMFHIE